MAGAKTVPIDRKQKAPISREITSFPKPEGEEIEKKFNVVVDSQPTPEAMELGKYEKGTARG